MSIKRAFIQPETTDNRVSQFDVLINEKARASRIAMQYPGSAKFKTMIVEKNADDQIPPNLNPNKKMTFMSNKMWECEVVGDHIKAEYWRRKIEAIKSLSKQERGKKLEHFYKKEFKALQLEFDQKCREVVDFYTQQIGNLNESSIVNIDALKLQQSEDQRVLKYALRSSFGGARINKHILSLRKIEYSLGQNKKFMDAQRVKEEIEALQRNKVQQCIQEKMYKDRGVKEQLVQQNKLEMRQLLNKLALKKALLYNKLQHELKKLENWKATHDDRLDSHYKKDFLKLNGKLLAAAPRSHQNRVDFILNPDFEQVNDEQSEFLKGPKSSKHALYKFRRSQKLYDLPKELKFVRNSKQALDAELNKALAMNENKIANDVKVTKGSFIQYIDGDDQSHAVWVEYDDKNKEIRWKRKLKKGSRKDMEMSIECKMQFDDIFDVEAPSMSSFFNNKNKAKYRFDKTKCFSIHSNSIKLHLQAKSIKVMKEFAEKLMDLILNHQNRKEVQNSKNVCSISEECVHAPAASHDNRREPLISNYHQNQRERQMKASKRILKKKQKRKRDKKMKA